MKRIKEILTLILNIVGVILGGTLMFFVLWAPLWIGYELGFKM